MIRNLVFASLIAASIAAHAQYPSRPTLLVVPYTADVNDHRFSTTPGFNWGLPFFEYLRDAFDVLYAEGAERPRMMQIGLHNRLVGRPGRIGHLRQFLDHVLSHDRVWLPRGIDIANHWISRFPAPAA